MEQAGDHMIYNFSEIKEQNERMENELLEMKREYQAKEMPKEQVDRLKKRMEEAKMADRKRNTRTVVMKFAATAAGLFGAFVILSNTSATIAHAMEQIPVLGRLVEVVTFRDYEYESERNTADIEVPEIVVGDVVTLPDGEQQQTGQTDEQMQASQVQEELEHTTEEINAEIQQITDEIIAEFESNLEYEEGYQDVMVQSEVLTKTEDYFTLKLICYQGAGSGYEWHYYYTIDLHTGERLQLKDIFVEGADYITPISDNIKEQMQAQMDADDMVHYWLNDEIEELNFKSITDETSFYINEAGNVVIAFNEGDVAPMYMGCVEFEIPAEVLQNIRK